MILFVGQAAPPDCMLILHTSPAGPCPALFHRLRPETAVQVARNAQRHPAMQALQASGRHCVAAVGSHLGAWPL